MSLKSTDRDELTSEVGRRGFANVKVVSDVSVCNLPFLLGEDNDFVFSGISFCYTYLICSNKAIGCELFHRCLHC